MKLWAVLGKWGGEREGGDGDDGVFDCGRGEDSAVEVKKEGWGWGGGGGTSERYLFSLSYKYLRAWRWRQRWPVHPLSCCSLEQCVGRRPLCGRSGRTGISQSLPGVSGGMEEGGGCEGMSLS